MAGRPPQPLREDPDRFGIVCAITFLALGWDERMALRAAAMTMIEGISISPSLRGKLPSNDKKWMEFIVPDGGVSLEGDHLYKKAMVTRRSNGSTLSVDSLVRKLSGKIRGHAGHTTNWSKEDHEWLNRECLELFRFLNGFCSDLTPEKLEHLGMHASLDISEGFRTLKLRLRGSDS